MAVDAYGNVRKSLARVAKILYDTDMKTEQIHNNFDLCYRAICSRDARFDGRFFTAVTSHGHLLSADLPGSNAAGQKRALLRVRSGG